MSLTKQVFLRWSDIDANYHLRHSVYYDFCAQHRIDILSEAGLTLAVMQQQHLGPVLFREECVFRKEIRFNDEVFVSTSIAKLKADASRFSIRHQLLNSEKLFAVITVDGSWMDTKQRKLLHPVPQMITDTMNMLPKTDDFEMI